VPEFEGSVTGRLLRGYVFLMQTILMTGHLGLVGRYLKPLLENHGFCIKGFDLADSTGDITQESQLQEAMKGCNGVIHLAAVSRVIWGEEDPERCWQTNALGSEYLIKQVTASTHKPWVLVASSREVYGEAVNLPVNEETPRTPVNVYGRAKLHMETVTLQARKTGINTAVVRLANVYGCIDDHPDRVLPAFCHNAVTGKALRVDGFKHLFDFTHISDTADGIARMVEILDTGKVQLPPIHLLPGIGTTLQQAAQLAVESSGGQSKIFEAQSRSYDVSRFVGDPLLAKRLLGWQAQVTPQQGIPLLVEAFKEKLNTRVST